MEGSKLKRNKLRKQVSELVLPKAKATKLKKEISSVRQRLKLLFGESHGSRKTKKTSDKQTIQRASSTSQLLYPIKNIPDVKASEKYERKSILESCTENRPTSIQEIWLNRPDDIYSGSNCSVAFFSICGDPDDTLTEDKQTQKRYCRDFTNWNLEWDSQLTLGSRKETYGSDDSNSDSSIGEHSKHSYTLDTKRKPHCNLQNVSCSTNGSLKDTYGPAESNSDSSIGKNEQTVSINRRKAKSTSALFGKRTISDFREPLQFCTYRSPVKKKAVRRKLQTFSKQIERKRVRDVKTLAIV